MALSLSIIFTVAHITNEGKTSLLTRAPTVSSERLRHMAAQSAGGTLGGRPWDSLLHFLLGAQACTQYLLLDLKYIHGASFGYTLGVESPKTTDS